MPLFSGKLILIKEFTPKKIFRGRNGAFMKLRRSFLVGGVMALELGLLLLAVWGLNLRAAYLYGAIEILSLIIVIFLIYSRDNPSYKLTWAVIILVFPLFGVFIYLIAGTHYLSPRLRIMLKRSKLFNLKMRSQDPIVMEELCREGGSYLKQARFLLSLSDKPVYRGTTAEILLPGEKMHGHMVEELKKAQKFIFMEYFIIAKGEMLDDIFDILKEKAVSGVEVRLIYDDAGCMDCMPKDFKEECARCGIKTAAFNPFIPVLNKFLEYRDHRKIVVIDGNVGYTGGANIADEYINMIVLHGYWYDGGICIRGDAVWNLTVMFLDMWLMVTGKQLQYEKYLVTKSEKNDGFVLPFNDSPFSGNVSEGAYMNIINNADRYVYIATPYLIIDHEMVITLCNTARAGVDVRIITPHIPDKKYVHAATRGYYQQLMEFGVNIYEYTPGFIHAKMVLCDDDTGIIGSVNMDYRSFYLQFEDAVWLCRNSALAQMKEKFEELFKVSMKIDPGKWSKRGFLAKIAEIIMRLFAPLM